MKPFSPLYFIKENRTRCLLLIFMLFLGYAAYLGGLYTTNPHDNWELACDYYDEFIITYPSSEDVDAADFYAFTEELQKTGKADILWIGENNSFTWKSIMGFTMGNFSFTFLSVEDFKTYCEHMDIECNFDDLQSGSLIMSERFAKNRGLALGDTIDKDYADNIYSEFTIDALTDEDGYTLYFIDEDSVLSNNILIFGKGIDVTEVHKLTKELAAKNGVEVYDGLRGTIEEQFTTFNMIYVFILVLLAVILAVTINAAFVGMYQRRRFEFAVYRAIGISKKRIVGKIIGELFWMDVIALTAGGAVFFFGLYLFNNLILYPVGLYLRYFHPLALLGLLFCNLAVVIPLILTRSRQMLKEDICEY